MFTIMYIYAQKNSQKFVTSHLSLYLIFATVLFEKFFILFKKELDLVRLSLYRWVFCWPSL